MQHRQMPQTVEYFGIALGEVQVKVPFFVPASRAGRVYQAIPQ